MNFALTLNGEASDLETVIRVLNELRGQSKTTAALPQQTDAQVYPQQAPVQQQAFQQLQPHFDQQAQQQQYDPSQSQGFPQQQPIGYPPQQGYQPQQQAQQGYQPQQPINGGVPVSTTTYDMSQLSVAATQLMDAGRKDELLGLLASFGVPALTMLPKEQYGPFATQLRAMGAKI